jgi:predicted dehydrogenase|tara:strand:+ start:4998 stop:6050 length:1053 start_codon:yes stop_codon:yes gene_type:complete
MINIAIIGAGIGREHLAALRELPSEFRVVAVVDQNLERIEEIRFGDTFAALTDISDVLTDPEIGVIDICLPPHLHVSVTLDALNFGKHVICEKPLATSLADVDRIAAAAKQNGCHVFPVFQYRWGPSLAQLRHLMGSGLAGQVQVASLETHWSRGYDYYSVPWRGTWSGERGGAILGHAIHNHDLLTHIAGDVAALSAMTATRVNEIETEDCASITFAMASGALCTSSITLGAAGDETRLRFIFENLTATSGTAPYAPGAQPWTFTARFKDQQHEIDKAVVDAPPEAVGFEGFFTEIGKAINEQENFAVTLEDGAASIALVTAIYHSSRTGERVNLPLMPEHELYKGWMP